MQAKCERGDEPIRPIKLIVASCTFSCRFLKIGVIRGTTEKQINYEFSLQETKRRLTKVLDGRIHLRHTHHVRDGTFCSDNTSKRVGIFFTKLFEQHQSELVKKLIFTALFDDNSKARSEIGGLLTDFGALVVEAPEDGGDDLGKVRFDADS